MDDYIPKPLKKSELERVLTQYLPDEPPITLNQYFSGLNPDDATETQLEKATRFMQQVLELAREVRTAVSDADRDLLVRVAQELGTVSQDVGADTLTQQAQQLEAMGKDGSFQWADRSLNLLEHQISRLQQTIETSSKST